MANRVEKQKVKGMPKVGLSIPKGDYTKYPSRPATQGNVDKQKKY